MYFACLTRFESHDEFFDLKHYFLKFCSSFVADFENLRYLVNLNDNMNGRDTNATFNILKGPLDCKSNHVIYLFECK